MSLKITFTKDGVETASRVITDREEAVLLGRLNVSIEEWILEGPLDGMINKCRKAILNKWTKIFKDDATVATIPASDDGIIDKAIAAPNYETRLGEEAREKAEAI